MLVAIVLAALAASFVVAGILIFNRVRARRMLAQLVVGAAAQVRHEARMISARGKEPVSVRLVPQAPIRGGDADGWLGGAAQLPPGANWPKIDDAPLQLLAQVHCAALPAGLWGGLGPRQGWLAIFIEPFTWAVRVLHFAEAGPLTLGPALPPNSNIVGYDMRVKPGKTSLIQAIPRWPVDIVAVVDGKADPRREGRSQIQHERYNQRHDIGEPALAPFDWPSAQTMMEMAIAGVTRSIPQKPAPHLEPAALAQSEAKIAESVANGASADSLLEQKIQLDELRAMAAAREYAATNGPVILRRLEDLKARIDVMAAQTPFSAASIAPALAELRGMNWQWKSVPPHGREGRKLSVQERFDEGVKLLTLPLTTHDPEATLWVYDFEVYRLDRAKHAYATDRDLLPEALRADCEDIWRDRAAHEMGGMGHTPWGYVHEFDSGKEVTLLELPSSGLMNWQFGDMNSLVLTMTKADLAAGAFGRVKMRVSN